MKLKGLFLSLFSVILLSCGGVPVSKIKNGDLVFVSAEKKNLSGAISRVTQKDMETSFDHVGLVEVGNGQVFVLHAAPDGGSKKELLQKFINSQTEKNKELVLFRLKSEYQFSIVSAVETANKMLGKPYNFNYILSESEYYCSDFIQRAFRKSQIFELNPMSFINPTTGKTDEFWQKYYNERGIEIPEGKLGCNPNGLSRSPKLMRIGKIK
ncbi:MAG: hypothetical protein KBA33_07605 [Cloacibacterium sp.]|nr:hypothetical protein [Cloacibacterium sp.]